MDTKLSDKGQVLPGLGDSGGDRQFRTPLIDDEQALLHPSKRNLRRLRRL
jgi:hypothetical protein